METYKVKIKKNIECREVQYEEGETYNVVRAVYNFLKHNNAIDKDQERPSHMTVDLYLNQNLKEEHASKRKISRDAPTTTTKRKKKE